MTPIRDVTLRFLAEPGESNFAGQVHGGSVMKWIDQAGYACAAGWSKLYCVTVYVGGIRFFSPVHIGDLVDVYAKVIYTGRTSSHISVDVWASDPRTDPTRKTTHCVIIFVALDDDGKPTEVPVWKPEAKDDIGLESYARRLMDLRKDIDSEMSQYQN